MSKLIRILVAAAALSAMVTALDVGVTHAATATTPATATVVSPLTITRSADLAFGSFIADAAGGTLKIDADATAALTASAAIHPMTSTHTAGKFDLGGSGGLAYTLTVPSTVTLTRTSGSETMTVGTLTTSLVSGNTISGGVASLPSGGTDTLYVGGILTVGASQVAGSYTGTLSIDVNYN